MKQESFSQDMSEIFVAVSQTNVVLNMKMLFKPSVFF